MDSQTLGCHRLICSVISLAIKDLCLKPYKVGRGYMISTDARSALDFFFRSGVGNRYLSLVGYDPEEFKSALISNFTKNKLTPQKRAFRYNYDRWVKEIRKIDRNFKYTKINLGK